MNRRLPVAALVVLAASSLAVTARAQGTADPAAAEALFKQARQLMAQGNYAEACPKLADSQRLDPGTGTLLNLATCYEKNGQIASAWATYKEAATSAQNAGESDRARLARSRAAALEPKLPMLTIVVPAASDRPNLTVTRDGEAVGRPEWGAPIPVDPGVHAVQASAPGRKTWQGQAQVDGAGAKASIDVPPLEPEASAPPESSATSAPPATIQASPPVERTVGQPAEQGSRTALLIGAHLGMELPTGQVPTPTSSGNGGVDIGDVSGGGIAAGLEAGLRFERHWYVGADFEYAGFGQGGKLTAIGAGTSKETSQTMQLAAVLGFIVNPDRVSFLGEVGLAYRWYEYAWTDSANTAQKNQFNTGELLLGAGIWIPVTRSLRIVPEATLNLGTFSSDGTGGNATTSGHAFIMLGVGGFFDVGL